MWVDFSPEDREVVTECQHACARTRRFMKGIFAVGRAFKPVDHRIQAAGSAKPGTVKILRLAPCGRVAIEVGITSVLRPRRCVDVDLIFGFAISALSLAYDSSSVIRAHADLRRFEVNWLRVGSWVGNLFLGGKSSFWAIRIDGRNISPPDLGSQVQTGRPALCRRQAP